MVVRREAADPSPQQRHAAEIEGNEGILRGKAQRLGLTLFAGQNAQIAQRQAQRKSGMHHQDDLAILISE